MSYAQTARNIDSRCTTGAGEACYARLLCAMAQRESHTQTHAEQRQSAARILRPMRHGARTETAP